MVFEKYSSETLSDFFNDDLKSNVRNVFSQVFKKDQRFSKQFKAEQFYRLFDLTCTSCDSIYSFASESNPTRSTKISLNLIYLHSILSDELFIKLMCKKSMNSQVNQFTGYINGMKVEQV